MTGDNVLLRQLLITAGCCPKSTETIGRVSVSWSPRTCHAGPVCHPHSPSIPCTLSSRVIVGALWMLLLPTYLPTRMGKSGSIVFLFFLDSGCRMFWDAASFVVQFYILPARLHGERRTLGCLKKIGFIFISTPASQPWNVSERRCSAQTRRKPRMKKILFNDRVFLS